MLLLPESRHRAGESYCANDVPFLDSVAQLFPKSVCLAREIGAAQQTHEVQTRTLTN